MKKSVSVLVLFSFVFLISSCATLFKGTRQEVSFNSNPQKAEVWVNGIKLGETPVSLKLECRKDYTIEFKMAGYQSVAKNISNHVGAGWIILDVLGGLIPIIVDAATGAWYSFDQKNVDAQLIKQQPQP